MAKKVNFTKEHLKELHEVYIKLSFSKRVLSGKFGANQLSPYDMLNSTNVDTMISLRSQLKKEIEAFEVDYDEFVATPQQNQTNTEKKLWERFLYLLIGYKKYQEQKAVDIKKLAGLKKQRVALKEETMTPKEKIKAMDKEIEKLSGLEEDELSDDFTEI